MERLYMHVGLHKTGTSAIQAFAEKNRVKLRDQGWLYPSYEPFLTGNLAKGHLNFAHAIARLDKRLSYDDACQLAEGWAQEAEKSRLKIFISAEAISRHLLSVETAGHINYQLDSLGEASTPHWLEHRRMYLKSLADALHNFHVTVLLVIRRQDDFARSHYQEVVNKKSNSISFEGHCKTISFTLLRFYESILLYEEFFDDVKVLTYEDLSTQDRLPQNFFETLGVSAEGMQDVGIIRESFSYQNTLAKNFIGQIASLRGNRRKVNRRVVDWIHASHVQAIMDKHLQGKTLDLWESGEIRRRFLRKFDTENEVIRAKYFPEKQNLFPPIPKDEVAPDLSELPEALKVDLLTAAKATGLIHVEPEGLLIVLTEPDKKELGETSTQPPRKTVLAGWFAQATRAINLLLNLFRRWKA